MNSLLHTCPPPNENQQGHKQRQAPTQKRSLYCMGTAQVLLTYFKQIEKAKKQIAKWNVTMLDDDIIIHVVDQMYESDWFSKETMTKWEETNDNTKM